jgi:hypothetical protein
MVADEAWAKTLGFVTFLLNSGTKHLFARVCVQKSEFSSTGLSDPQRAVREGRVLFIGNG